MDADLPEKAPKKSRVLAIVLPDLACEIAALARDSSVGIHGALTNDAPLAVVLAERPDDVKPSSPIHAVTMRARRSGIFPGQTLTAARALVATLDVRRVAPSEVRAALERVAEIGLAFGPIASVAGTDAVLVDVSGSSRLFASEDDLLAEALDRVRALGHRVRGAIASGAEIARAVAKFGAQPRSIVAAGREREAMASLPVASLPLDDATAAWLARVGIFTVADLARQPRATVTPRLGARAAEVFALIDGDDRTPLVPYVPPRSITEEIAWDDAVHGTEPLLFALRGLVSRLAARLEGRAEATNALVLELDLDASIAALAGASPKIAERIHLAVPLARPDDLLRILRTRIDGKSLPAPVRAVRLVAPSITSAHRVQLDLSRDVHAAPEALPVLLAELTTDLGEDRVGLLVAQSSHVPELRTVLVPLDPASLLPKKLPARRTKKKVEPNQMLLWPTDALDSPVRLLPAPIRIEGRLAKGAFVTIERAAFTVADVRRTERLDEIGWWTSSPTSRDYAAVWLKTGTEGGQAWVMRDRRRGGVHVHGWFG